MPLWTQPAILDMADAKNNDRLWYFQHRENPGIGYVLTMKSVGVDADVHFIYSVSEGVARPAWRPAGVAESLGGSAFRTSSTDHNRYWYSLDADNKTLSWTVPASGNGMDKIVVHYTQVAGAGEIEAYRNPAGANELLGSVDTNGGSTDYTLSGTITCSTPLAAGDVILFRRKAGDATGRFQSFFAYDSDGTVSDYATTFAIPSQTVVDYAGSSVEFAYQLAPTGQSVKFIGGYVHQGAAGGYCSEVNVVDSWTRNGAAWTPATGWIDGNVVLSRTSDVDYEDAGHTILGSFAYSYAFDAIGYTVTHEFTAAEALDIGALYPVMVDGGTSFKSGVFRMGSYWQLADITAGDNSHVAANEDYDHATKGVIMIPTPLGACWSVDVLSHSHPWEWYGVSNEPSFFIQGATNRKWYCTFQPTLTAGAKCSCSWRSRFVNVLRPAERGRHLLLP